MLIYLKGISSAELEPVADFLYNGEAFITQEYLKTFLATAKELQIKGLLVGLGENTKKTKKTTEQSEEKVNVSENFENIADEVGILDPLEELVASFDNGEATLVKTDNSRSAMINKDVELDFQIKEIIEKNEGLWRCKLCGKTSTGKSNAQRHAETHIDGVSHACHICNKTFSTRPCLQSHISRQHSDLFSCDICGKTGMNR